MINDLKDICKHIEVFNSIFLNVHTLDVDTPQVICLRQSPDRGPLYKIVHEMSLRAFLTETPMTSSKNSYIIEKVQALDPSEESFEARLLRRQDTSVCILKEDGTPLAIIERGIPKIFSVTIFSRKYDSPHKNDFPAYELLSFEEIQKKLNQIHVLSPTSSHASSSFS